MASLGRIVTKWTGFVGADGFSTHYFTGAGGPTIFDAADAAVCAARIRTLFDAIKAAIPTGVSLQVLQDAAVLESTSGDLTSLVSTGAIAVVNGTGTGTAARGAGGLLSWRSATVRNRRLMRGRTFLTPFAQSAVTAGGDVSAATASTMLTAGNALIAGTSQIFQVYHRPLALLTDGTYGPVVACLVPIKPSILRSRRD